MTRRGDGTGELIDAVPFSRVLRFSADTLGTSRRRQILHLVELTRRARTLIYPTEATANIWKMHEECFQFGDSTFNDGIALSTASPSDLDIPTAIIFQKPGKVRASMFVGVSASGGSGTVPDDHGLAFVRLDGTDGPPGALPCPSGHRDQRERDLAVRLGLRCSLGGYLPSSVPLFDREARAWPSATILGSPRWRWTSR